MNSEASRSHKSAIEQLVEALNAGHSEALARIWRQWQSQSVLVFERPPYSKQISQCWSRCWLPHLAVVRTPVKQGEKGIHDSRPMFRKRTENADESSTTEESRRLLAFARFYVWTNSRRLERSYLKS